MSAKNAPIGPVIKAINAQKTAPSRKMDTPIVFMIVDIICLSP